MRREFFHPIANGSLVGRAVLYAHCPEGMALLALEQ